MNKTPELLSCPITGTIPLISVYRVEGGYEGRLDVTLIGLEMYAHSLNEGPTEVLRLLTERWNTRVYPPEIQMAIERDTPKKLLPRDVICSYGKCPNCDSRFHLRTLFCLSCG